MKRPSRGKAAPRFWGRPMALLQSRARVKRRHPRVAAKSLLQFCALARPCRFPAAPTSHPESILQLKAISHLRQLPLTAARAPCRCRRPD